MILIWIVIIGVIIGIVYNSLIIHKEANERKQIDSSVNNIWSEFEQTTIEEVNENWRTYLNRARQEDLDGKAVAGSFDLSSLVHNFLWCVYALEKFASDCHGSLSVQTNGETYSIQATAQLRIDELGNDRKYQVLYQTMIESFFIETPGIRLEFSDHIRDVDHEALFPWVSKDHSMMIPTRDYYVIGMHFSVSNITSINKGSLSLLFKTPKDIIEFEAKQQIKYGLTYVVSESNDRCDLNFTGHYTEPTVD